MVASCRIARFISEELALTLVHTPDQLEEVFLDVELVGLDKFILVNSPTGFAEPEMREACAKLAYLAKDPIFVQNDYKMKPPSQCKSVCIKEYGDYKGESSDFYGMRLWTTVPEIVTSTKLDYINWNQLTYQSPEVDLFENFKERDEDILYWGALRKGREQRLSTLLGGLSCTVSTSPQSVNKFKEWLPSANYVKPFKQLHDSLKGYQITIYTQDEYSDTNYCSLANRFYEALSCGIAILIDSNCVGTFKRSGLQGYEEFVVDDADDIALVWDAESIAKYQQELWADDYLTNLKTRLHELYGA